MRHLLDANVLIALTNQKHIHHARAREWFAHSSKDFATCPMTQGTLVRHYYRELYGAHAVGAQALLSQIENMPGHEFWPDSLAYSEVNLSGVIGHRQVTDAYLVSLASNQGGKLATLDEGLAKLHGNKVTFVA